MEKAKIHLALIVLLTITIASGTALAAAPTDGLIAHWKFDEASGTIAADSAGNNDATIHGAQWTQGVMAGALDFDGVNDYAQTTTMDELGSAISVCAWINIDDLSENRSIFGRDKMSSVGCLAFQNYLRVQASSRIGFGDRTGDGQSLNVYSNTLLQLNRWYHIAVTRDASNQIKIYIDGVLDISESRGTYSVPGLKYRIGRLNIDLYPFDGGIDDIRIYNRALTDQEVQQVYNDAFAVLTGLEITGPDEVAEDSPVPYKAIAHYDNGSTADVTDLAEWAVEPNALAAIETGVLTSEKINKQYKDITIFAQYSEGGILVDAQKPVTIYAACPAGAALDFDGVDDYVALPNLAITGTEFTISAWANMRGLGGGKFNLNSIFTQRDGTGGTDHVAVILYAEYTEAKQVAYADIRSSHGYLQSVSHVKMDYGSWHHYAVTVSSQSIILYVDGVEVDKTSNQQHGDYVTSVDYVDIAGSRYGTDVYPGSFNGSIDDVRVYDRPLSGDEIKEMFESKSSNISDGLVGYWDFDEGEGDVAYDLSGNENDGTLVNGPVWVRPGATLGVCTVPEVVERNMAAVVEKKMRILEILEEVEGDELASIEMLDEFFRSGDTGDLNKGGIAESKQKINTAMQHEDQAADAVERSIEKIDEAKEAIGIE